MSELTEDEFMECEEAERRKHDEKVRELEHDEKLRELENEKSLSNTSSMYGTI